MSTRWAIGAFLLLHAGFFEQIARAIPNARRIDFKAHRLPPTPEMVCADGNGRGPIRFWRCSPAEEAALQIAGSVLTLLNGAKQSGRQPSRRDENRIMDALHLIETRYCEPLSIAELARETA